MHARVSTGVALCRNSIRVYGRVNDRKSAIETHRVRSIVYLVAFALRNVPSVTIRPAFP